MPFIDIFQICVAFIQSEGRSVLCGILQLVGFILNCGFFGPIFLFGFKVSLNLAGLSFGLSQALPGIILIFLIFMGKFDLKPEIKQFFAKPSPETLQGIITALPFVLNVIAGSFPPMLLINFMMKEASIEGIASEVGEVYSIFLKIQVIVNSFSISISQGQFATGSNAYGANQNKRILLIFIGAILLSLVLQIIFLPLLIGFPQYAAYLWMENSNSSFVRAYLKIPFYTNWLTAINEAITNFLMILQYPKTAMMPSLLRGVGYIIFSLILYYTKNDAIRMMYTYNLNDALVLLVDLIIIFIPLKRLLHTIKSTENEHSNCDLPLE